MIGMSRSPILDSTLKLRVVIDDLKWIGLLHIYSISFLPHDRVLFCDHFIGDRI